MLASFALAAALLAQQPPSDLIQRIQNAYKAVKTVQMRAELRISANEKEDYVAYLDFVRDGTSKLISLSDGEKSLLTWIETPSDLYLKSAGELTFSPLKHDQPSGGSVVDRVTPSSLNLIFFSPDGSKISLDKDGLFGESTLVFTSTTVEGREWYVIERIRKDALEHYYVDPKTYYVWKADNQDPKTKQDRTSWEVKKLETNGKIDPKVFERPKDPLSS